MNGQRLQEQNGVHGESEQPFEKKGECGGYTYIPSYTIYIYFYDVSLYSCIYAANSPMPGILGWRAISAAVGGSLLLDGFELRASGKALKASNMGRSKGEQNIV